MNAFDEIHESNDDSRTVIEIEPAYVPLQAANVFELDMDDGSILFDRDSSLVHHLNRSAAIIWKLCDGGGTVSELVHDIASEFALDADRALKEVATVIAEFDALGLVIDARSG